MGDAPYWAASDAQMAAHGHLGFGHRPADVQRVMQHMYGNGGRYRSISALFVSQMPMARDGCLRIVIQQPAAVRTAAYDNSLGLGVPAEITIGQGGTYSMYSPALNQYVVISQRSQSQLPPLDTIPLSVVVPDASPTTIQGSVLEGGRSVWADMFLHPAALITSSFFGAMQFSAAGTRDIAGRSAWELDGTLAPNADPNDGGGPGFRVDGMKLWVDRQTGIVLRLEFHAQGNLLGWAELQQVRIDGEGTPPDSTMTALASGVLPASATPVANYHAFANLVKPLVPRS